MHSRQNTESPAPYNLLRTVTAPDYVPTDDEPLRAMIRTIGANAVTLDRDGEFIHVLDLSSQVSFEHYFLSTIGRF
jgi:hypothetical protein